MPLHTFVLFADYHQFYLQDENASGDLSNAWTPEATERLLAVAPGVVGVGTASDMNVPVEVEVRAAPPPDDGAAWDRVNDCTIDVPSGRVVIAGCTDYFPDAARIQVMPGSYNVRVHYAGLTVPDATAADERYRVVLWPK